MPIDWVQLAQRARAGDRSAFRTLVDHTHVPAFRLAYRVLGDRADAEDAVQEAYLQVWNGRSNLRDPVAARAWIYAIVRNVASSRARGRARRSAREIVGNDIDMLGDYLTCERPGPEHAAATTQMRSVVLEMIAQLKDKHRVVLLLRAVDGMSYDELSETLGVPVGTVESRIHRARKHLARKLERALGRSFEVSA